MEETQPRIAAPSRRMLTITPDGAPDIMRKGMRKLASEGDLAPRNTNPREN